MCSIEAAPQGPSAVLQIPADAEPLQELWPARSSRLLSLVMSFKDS